MGKGALEGNRLMSKDVGRYIHTYEETDTEWPALGSWQTISVGAPTGIYSEDYFDLSGYALSDLTVFPLDMLLQDPGLPYYYGPTSGSLRVVDIISQERLDISETYTQLTLGSPPGSNETIYDWEQILMCDIRYMTSQQDFTGAANLQRVSSAGSFGSGSPTTVQKLWCYRIIIPSAPSTGDLLQVPSTRFVMSTTAAYEGDLPFLMRQKRSYELATQG